MKNFTLFLSWYFKELPQKIYRIWTNFLWFFNNYFSLIDLFKTFFYPWKGYYYPFQGTGFDPAMWLGNIIFNIFSSLMGMIFRSFIIIIGVIVEIFAIILGILFFFFWLVFPIVLVLAFFKGVKLF